MTAVSPTFVEALRDAAVFAPELPEDAATDTFNIIQDYERRLVLPHGTKNRELLIADYGAGSATGEDEIEVYNPDVFGLLASADHATDPMRKGVRYGADHGTAGLVAYLAIEHELTGIVPNGLITGSLPVKLEMDKLLPSRTGFLSVHGMRPGKLLELDDKTEIHGLIGLGATPNDSSRSIAEQVSKRAQDYGLRVLIGNDTSHKEYDVSKGDLLRDKQTGEPKTTQLAARSENSTTTRAYSIMQERDVQVPAFQIELTRLLRLIPSDFEAGWHVDRKAREMGVYLGYLLTADIVALMSQDSSDNRM
jgi:hypothetical protein